MKSPPVQIVDDEAHENTERFIKQNGLKAEKKAKAASRAYGLVRRPSDVGRAHLGGPFRLRSPARGAVSSATKPISRWVVSQNGLFFEWPQRQSTIELPGGSSNGTSSASMIVTGPVTLSGPFARTWIVTSVMARL